MGGKAEKGTPKYIANKIKAKGLQKLRWYCQMCQKQCRDENGFKCHTMSESHQRQLLLFADNASKYIDNFSTEFADGYIELLSRQFGTKRVNANKVYQDYISNRDHLHMNATQWETLTEFVKWLGREGKCVVDETEKGWFVTYIDRDPATIAAQEAKAKKEKMDKDDQASVGAVAPVNSLLQGFYLLAGPFVSALANKYGFRFVTILGSIVTATAFSLSYFASSVEYLYLIYGVLGGVGFCMIYMPAVLTVGFYFERWRALATGLALCGSGVGTFVFAPVTGKLIDNLGWRMANLANAAFVLICLLCGLAFRPIKPTRVTLADQSEEDETSRRHEEAVEKLNSMLKLHNKLDTGISMPPEMRFTNKVSPHTWMGVANNTRYPTAEEVFRGSSSHLSRRSSATASTIKNNLCNKPLFIAVPVAEKDEQEDSNSNIDNVEPLIANSVKIVTRESRPRRSHLDLVARPFYRDDIFFEGSLARLPQYTSRTSLGYHLAVTHVPTKEDTQEEQSGTFKLCPEAIRRALATMLDVSLFRSPTFNILAISGFFTMLGFFVPYMYLEERAADNGWSKSKTVWLISTIGIANILGRIACGIMSSMQNVSPLWLNNIALTAGGIATMLSGQDFSEFYQFGYCVVFGLAAACFASLRSILVVEYIGLEQLTNCFGLFLLFQGFGALLGVPIAGALMDLTNSYTVSFCVSGSFLLLSAVMCYPVDYISRWEKSRSKLSTPKV